MQNLLDMTELVTENMRFDRQSLNVRELIEAALERLARLIASRPVRFDCPENIPAIEGDQEALRHVFVNVIENACKYSPPHAPISITVDQDGPDIKIIITDNGPGIPKSERMRVFDMFYRIKSGAATGSVSGAGLGLSICRGFVTAHKGHISAHSGDAGVGTKIIIRLPIRQTQQA